MEYALLDPVPYHQQVRDFLKEEEREVWNWFAGHKTREEQADSVRFDLLKRTYRIERTADPELYAMADDVAAVLSLDVPITIYQAQNPEGLNAGLAYLPGEAHIVFSGPLQSKLSRVEMRSVLGHELAHYSLWHRWDGEFLIADQILAALTHDEAASTAHVASARLFGLYGEIFGDRGALLAVGDPLVVVSALVKLETGLDEVNAESYIRQAEEIFSKGPAKTAGLTHPEAFIRARAVRLWHEEDEHADEKITEMIEGALALEDIDLLGQRKIAGFTRRLIDTLLAHTWLQTDPIIGHARLFFPDYSPPAPPNRTPKDSDDRAEANDVNRGLADVVDQLAVDLASDDKSLNDYYCYVLLDFVTADRELDEMPLAAALVLSERLGLHGRFVEVVGKELRLGKRQLEKIDRQKESMLGHAAAEARTS